ncbi:MAG: hypothetical protein KF709_09395 [Gemmatimonadaceae bacterium]|nr:hypothetical protein [Gemmatimonadaceae bacterium]
MAQQTLRGFTDRLATAFGEELRAVVLYGSAVGRPEPSRGTMNLLVLVGRWRDATSAAAGEAVREWTASGQPAPLILTEGEWRSTRDVFAMEHADIAARHELVAGQLPAEPAPSPEDLRSQLEYEAMGALIHLRQGMLVGAGDAERSLQLLLVSKGTVLTLFRTLLRLEGWEVPPKPEAVVQAAAAIAGFEALPFERLLAHTAGTAALDAAGVTQLLTAYHAGLQRFVAYVDALVHPGSSGID